MAKTPDQRRIDPIGYAPIVGGDKKATNFFATQWARLVEYVYYLAEIERDIETLDAEVAALQATEIGGDGTYITPGLAPLSAGDITLTLADSGVTAATYGDATNVPQIAVDAKGRLTGVTNVPITGAGGSAYGSFFSPKAGASTTTFPTEVTNGTAAGSSSDETLRGLVMETTAGGSDDWYMRLQTAAVPGSGTTTYISRLLFDSANVSSTGGPGLYMLIRNSTSGRIYAVGIDGTPASGNAIFAGRWQNDVYSAAIGTNCPGTFLDAWVRIDVSSAGAVDIYRSTTGDAWILIGSTTLAAYLTATGGSFDQIGFGLKCSGNVTGVVPFFSDDGDIDGDGAILGDSFASYVAKTDAGVLWDTDGSDTYFEVGD